MHYDFAINPDHTITKTEFDKGKHFVLVIDDLLQNPEEVVHFAKHSAYFNPVGADGSCYPGIRDVMPAPYARALMSVIQPLVAKHYFCNAALDTITPMTKLSLVTLKPEQLRDSQRVPHVDCDSNNEFALLHYFCSEIHGGTSLYRYKPSGQVQVENDYVSTMKQITATAMKRPDEHQGYLNGDTSVFERAIQVKAKFNRLVLFKGNLLHCADINSTQSYSDNISEARLSIASFMYFAAQNS
jgi:hypothetical protein